MDEAPTAATEPLDDAVHAGAAATVPEATALGNGDRRAIPATPDPEAPDVQYDPSTDVGVSFDKVAEAHFFSQAKFNPSDPVGRTWFGKAYAPRYAAFEQKFGRVTHHLYCTEVVAAVVLTDQDRIFTVNNEIGEEAAGIVKLLYDADRLETEVRQNFEGPRFAFERRTALEMLYSVNNSALALLDNTQLLDPEERRVARSHQALPFQNLLALFDNARAYYERVAQRIAQIQYFQGMVTWGLGLLALALLAVALLAALLSDAWRRDLMLAAGTFVAGGIGAIVSVMSRMTSGKLELDHTVGWNQVRLLGAFRPLIGAIFGLALYALIAGGLIPVAGPTETRRLVLFYCGLAFLAGFSERFAQDMLSGAGDRVLRSRGDGKAVPGGDGGATEGAGPASPP